MKLGLMLASPPDRPELGQIHRLALEARRGGEDVYLYLIDDGVKTLDRPEIEELRKGGVHLFACAYGAKKRGIAWDPEKAAFSGLTVLVDVIAGCDRFLAFTPLGSSPQAHVPAPIIPGGRPRTLVTITEDPRESHRPAEAIRIAAGIGGWNKTDVDLLLRGPAAQILSPYADEFVDGDNYHHYLPILRDWKRPVYLAPDAEDFAELKETEILHERCDDARVEALKKAAIFFIPF